jgi:type VI secretion system protein ImpG
MAVARFYPDGEAMHSRRGQALPRGTRLTSREAVEARTACEFRTSQDVTLWPLSLRQFEHVEKSCLVRGMNAKF